MGMCKHISHRLLASQLLLLLVVSGYAESHELQTYIIQLDHSYKPDSFLTHEIWHRSILKSLSQPAHDQEMLLYSYSHAFNGFSARLTKSQLAEIEESPAHLATYKESFGNLHTTRSTSFLGLNHHYGLWPSSTYGEGVIIGVVDTGIWPESESFRDRGMPLIPKKWKGNCENGTAFNHSMCNKKLIGARSFSKGLKAAGLKVPSPDVDYDSPRDFDGHGTHTSSTAAGNHVSGANCLGQARGTARGVAPLAHVAMYKALFKSTEENLVAKTDVLYAIDQAIADGVDILSMSLGFPPTPYYEDPVAIGALTAMEKGIFVSCSAGNVGEFFTIVDGAPWITTVGASKLDRIFTATLTLESGFIVEAPSYYFQNIYLTDTPFYHSKCSPGELDGRIVAGKVVFCDQSSKVNVSQQLVELLRVGARAGIVVLDAVIFAPIDYPMPFIVLSSASSAQLRNHLTKSSTLPMVKTMSIISTKTGVKPAPQVASFSSRGPDRINPGILKPDIIAPGVDILAAYAPNKPYMQLGQFNLVTDYALSSGTSMAAPHVAGLGALIKKVHPEWSPSAIRSALMTTAYMIDNTGSIMTDIKTGKAATPLAFGNGHVDPNKAMDPGLIYDISNQDYVDFICSLGYTDKRMRAVTRQSHWNCSRKTQDLNYPSFMAFLTNESSSHTVKKYRRTVTNVGGDAAVYRATIDNIPAGLKITVQPKILSFTRKHQKQSFRLSLEIDRKALSSEEIYAFLKWTDQHKHVVSSPIMVAILREEE
uniref:Subtilisin-like protease n=1 Tax=Rhizophora mucronata TaxID=61149 RepID=A0A2P2Q300_RHIMU